MGLIYIASPYSTDDDHVREERVHQAWMYFCYLHSIGRFAISPIAMCHRMVVSFKLPGDHKYWEDFDKLLIDGCEELHVLCLDGWKDSKGINMEVLYAVGRGMRVAFMHPQFFTEYVIPANSSEWTEKKTGKKARVICCYINGNDFESTVVQFRLGKNEDLVKLNYKTFYEAYKEW